VTPPACETAPVLTLESGSARLVVAPERGGRIMALSVHAICVEPHSHPLDAFNLGPTVARPGAPVVATPTWSWEVECG
jgi:galactose mutarotase-like enzyme